MNKTFEKIGNSFKKVNKFVVQLTYLEIAVIIMASLNLGLFYSAIFKYLTSK